MTVSEVDESELLEVAVRAAQAGARELSARFGRSQDGVRTKSDPTDPVSEADLAAEAAIRRVLSECRPGDAILAEEGGASGDGKTRWLVDPLDGTVNFLFGIPAFAVSIACESAAGTLAGVVLDPLRDECFAATRTGPFTLNGEPVTRPERSSKLELAIVATGFAYDAEVRERQARVVARLLPRVANIRRVGAAALDLAWCASGRFDAYYERGLNPWDDAAGALIASRAGLAVRELPATRDEPPGVIAAPSGLIDELVALVVAS
jgi:myo-inositol-1(or 4)-monophosphatase